VSYVHQASTQSRIGVNPTVDKTSSYEQARYVIKEVMSMRQAGTAEFL
jgi:hypothetical protein